MQLCIAQREKACRKVDTKVWPPERYWKGNSPGTAWQDGGDTWMGGRKGDGLTGFRTGLSGFILRPYVSPVRRRILEADALIRESTVQTDKTKSSGPLLRSESCEIHIVELKVRLGTCTARRTSEFAGIFLAQSQYLQCIEIFFFSSDGFLLECTALCLRTIGGKVQQIQNSSTFEWMSNVWVHTCLGRWCSVFKYPEGQLGI